jgi:hypothetical protein
LAFQGFAAYRLGKMDSARQTFKRAAEIAKEVNTFVGKVFTTLLSLPLTAQEAQGETALALYTGLKQIPIVANSVFIDHIIGRQIEALFADVSVQTREEAVIRGNALTIDEILASTISLLKKDEKDRA